MGANRARSGSIICKKYLCYNFQVENTVLSFVTAAKLGAKFVEFDIQITDDQAVNIAPVGQASSYIEEAKK
jgi:glycerophosphoryl diester phosphodiesterase